MKNRGIVYIFISIILIIIVCFFVFIKYDSNEMNPGLLNKKWYHYDNLTGYYDVFYIDNKELKFDTSNKKYESCTGYNYNKSNNELKLNCDKKIIIDKLEENKIVLNIDSKKIVFFDNIDNSLNYEFEVYFKKSMVEFKKEKKVVSEFIKINYSRFLELFNSNEFSYVIFFDNNCSSVDCVLSLNTIEKWITKYNNIYYVNINDFSDKEIESINEINNNFVIDKNYYNGIYPRIMVINNKSIYKDFEIKCKGFDCTSYDNILKEDNYE